MYYNKYTTIRKVSIMNGTRYHLILSIAFSLLLAQPTYAADYTYDPLNRLISVQYAAGQNIH